MTTIQGAGPVQQTVDIQSMDVETAMMAVQSNRANLLEDQLKSQMEQVQKKNEKISQLNRMMGALNGALSEAKSGTKNEDQIKLSPGQKAEVTAAAEQAGIPVTPELVGQEAEYEVKLVDGTTHTVDTAGKQEAQDYKDKNWAFRSDDYSGAKGVSEIKETKPEINPTKGDLDKAVANLKGQIDALSNSQQMDMLRLQSLSNKRNEAFDLMSNFVKKNQDNRSSIVGNMR
jgi:hypothetical protein